MVIALPLNADTDEASDRIGTARLVAIALCVVICLLDGYDSQSVAVTSTFLVRDLGLSPRSLGLLLGVHTIGLAVGSLGLAPFADLIGRRPIILCGLVIITVGMALVDTVSTLQQFIAVRILTGAGVGTLLASVNTLVAEHAPVRWRNFAISAFVVAFPIGSGLAGLCVPPLVARHGWQAVYLVGATASLLLIPLFLLLVPESMSFLSNRRPLHALDRLNRVRNRFGLSQLAAFPAEIAPAPRASYAAIFRGGMAPMTFWVCLTFAMFEASTYFVLGWTPMILARAGFGDTQAVLGSVTLTMGGAVGGLALGVAATRISAAKLTTAAMVIAFVGFVIWGQLPPVAAVVLSATFVVGFFLFAGSAGKFTVVAAVYPPEMRVTGLGFALAMGRLGASVGPFVAGVLLSLKWERGPLMLLLGLPLLIAAFAIDRIRRLLRARSPFDSTPATALAQASPTASCPEGTARAPAFF